MKVGKPKSKRVPVRLRHKIEKASVAKQRKSRKEAKKNPQWRSRLKKDPGIPNLFPYKAKLLADIEEGKRKKEEEVQRRREVAKAQRLGGVVVDAGQNEGVGVGGEEESDEELLDVEDDLEEDEDMDDDDSNPMAALVASAQARAQAYTQEGADDGNEDDSEEDDIEEWAGIDENTTRSTANHSQPKTLPKQALADPIKAISALLERMQETTDGIQRLIEHYNIPPLATTVSDFTSRFLVEVARKRGRLNRGGVPNLHSAALTVLNDLNEDRLILPSAVVTEKMNVSSAAGKGEVRIVSQKAEPFRIEGLWDDASPTVDKETEKMVVEV